MPPKHEYANGWLERLDPPQGFLDNMVSSELLILYKEQSFHLAKVIQKVLQENLTIPNYMGHQVYHVLTVID